MAFEAVRTVLHSEDLTPQERGSLEAIATGALWTGQRLREAGYVCDGVCHRCDLGCDDTLFHRMWVCPSTAALRSNKPGLVRRARQEGAASAAYTMGIIHHPAETREGPLNDLGVVYEGDWEEEAGAYFNGGDWYLDGSCQPHPIPAEDEMMPEVKDVLEVFFHATPPNC